METGKPGLVSAPVHINSVAAQREKAMDIQAPLTAFYIHTVPALPAQPYPAPPAAAQEPATLHLAMPPLYSKETPLPFLTFHIAGGLQSQPGLSVAAASAAAKPKSAGKHVCPHCGRDCMKPSVLEKHLRCHTGERPYPCTTCGISFKTQSNLYKHKRTQAHARLSSESEQSSLGSLDSMSSSRETCTSSLSVEERSEESCSMEKDATPRAAEITCPASVAQVQDELIPADHKAKEPNESGKVTTEGENQQMENEKPQLTRHLPLQRQEATLFSKQWESSVSRGKSQSHESTDSGFSESSDHYPSPGSVLLDHSMDSLTESTKEHLEETTSTQTTSGPAGGGGQKPKDTAREQEHKTLEERISKLISENNAVVEDKQLENVRPRKTVLSKQGSIDLPMPYTYKDSFHFDMKNNKTPNVGLQRNRKPGFYSSVPTQCSTATEHAPLTRSNSLPFSVTLLQPERSSPTSSYQSDYVTLVRRGSSGQINPTGFAIKPVNQQSSTHRPLVRQTAVDCNHATDGLFMNSSVEEACTGSLSCDGDGGDICGEPSNRKFRRKKAQKFAYNKWYMYGGGTFKKLYSPEKGGDDSVNKGRKSSMTPEHEAVQKRLSAVQKETVRTSGSTVNFTSSSATVGHADCPPAKLSLVSAVDFNLKTNQLHASGSSLKSPLRKNLSLSVLPLPLSGSLVSHKTDTVSRAEDGRLNNEEKHTESSSQLCGSQIPSDRKKQKTDDKIICPQEMETHPNTLTHPPPTVNRSAPQQDTNLSYINIQNNLKHTQLKATLFPPCIINANTPSVSTSPATSTPSAAKTSFLPKYQLKLPNASEPDSNPSSHAVEKLTATDGRTFTSALSSSHAEQIPASEKKSSDPVTSLPMQSSMIQKSNAFSSAQGQLLLPCTATTLHQVETSSLNKIVTSSQAVVHGQFAATTTTTTCMQAGLCSTSVQSSESAGGSAPVQLPRPVVVNFPAAPPVTAGSRYPTSAAVITAVSQDQPKPNPPLSDMQLLPASAQLSPGNRLYASSSAPIVPCHVVPFDQVQPAAQHVFHVHTADLQICLQIISDEQLALIEPQIERQVGSALSQRPDTEAVTSEAVETKVQSSIAVERDNQQAGHHKELGRCESLPAVEPVLSAQFGKAEAKPHQAECSNSPQIVSTESKPPEALGLSHHPHKHSHVNTVTESQSVTAHVMSTAASLKGAKSGRNQTSEEERSLSLKYPAEEPLLPEQRASHGGQISQSLAGQNKLSVTSLSSSVKNQNCTTREILGKESQCKRATCDEDKTKAKSQASAYKSSRLESGETHGHLQISLGQASGVVCVDDVSGSVSSFFINKCRTSRQLKPQASIYCSNPVEAALSEALNSSKHTNMGCDRMSPMDSSAPSQEMTLNESQDIINSAHSGKQLGQLSPVSSNIQVERPKDIPAMLTSIQSPTAGFMEGDSLTGRVALKEPLTRSHGETPGQPIRTDQRPKKSQEAGETNHQCMEGLGGGGVAGEDKNGGLTTDEVPAQCGKAELSCRYTCLQDMTKPEGEDRQAKVDPLKNTCRSEQHLQRLSQTHSGMAEYPQQSPQQAQSMSNNLNVPASSSQTSIFNSPQPPLEITNFYFSQQPWEGSIVHHQQMQLNPSQHVKAQVQLSETQNAFSQNEPDPQQTQTISQQDQKQTSISMPAQQGDTTADQNITAVSCCSKLTLGCHKSLLPDGKTSSSTHPSQVSYSLQVSKPAPGLTEDTQASNNNVLDNNTVLPSKPFTYSQPDDHQGTKDKTSNDLTSQSSNCDRPDITNKYQSFLFAGPLHGYQPPECLTGGVRPVQSCQVYTEDTSSSDDEGKLIIEL